MKIHRLYGLLFAGLFSLLVLPAAVSAPPGYVVVNITTDFGGPGVKTDPDLVNPWGLIAGPDSIWVVNNGTGSLKAYNPSGKAFNFDVNSPGGPTGLAMNDTKAFVLSVTNTTKVGTNINKTIKRSPATFVMATESGTILAWSKDLPGSNARVMSDRRDFGAVYKGVAIARSTNGLPRIYAANFHVGVIDIYDDKFNFVGSFADPGTPGGYGPFNIQNIRGKLFVTYAKQAAPDFVEEDRGPGNGFVDIFDADGALLRRVVTGGDLNAPWGMAIAPKNFGKFSNALLVGNFGDGRINAYDVLSGEHLGPLASPNGQPIEIDGLWGLDFDQPETTDACAFTANRLYFTAGIEDETHGVLGYIRTSSLGLPFR